MKRFLLLLSGMLVLASPALADSSPITVEVDDREIFENEWVDLTVTVLIDHVNVMQLKSQDFRIQELEQGIQPGCGFGMRKEIFMPPCSFTYRLFPLRTGTLKTPVATIRGDGFFRNRNASAKSEQFDIVVKSGQGKKSDREARKERSRRKRQGQVMSGGETSTVPEGLKLSLDELGKPESLSRYDVFVVPRLVKTNPRISEPLRVDYILYIADDAAVTQVGQAQLPDTEGFRRESLEGDAHEIEAETLGERRYRRISLGRYVLIPLKEGSHELAAPKVTIMANRVVQQMGTGFSISISAGGAPIEVRGPSIDLVVEGLPEPMPKGMSKANVGTFTLTGLEPPEGREAGTWLFLRYRIEGSGNLYGLEAPLLSAIPGVTVREAAVDRSEVVTDEQGIHGALMVTVPFRSDRVGALDLGSLVLDFFNPETGAYEQQRLALPTLTMVRPTTENRLPEAGVPQDRVRPVVPADLTPGIPPAAPGPGTWLYLLAAALVALAALPWLSRVVLRLASGLAAGTRTALSQARKQLQEVEKLQDAGRFYSGLARVLSSFIGARFGLAVSGLTGRELRERLQALGVDQGLVDRLLEEMEGFDFARFSPTAGTETNRREAMDRVRALVSSLDQTQGRR